MACIVTEERTPRDETILSVSQIETWLSCIRKGGFKYLAHLPDPGNEDTDVGKRFHKVNEDWLTQGIKPDEDTQEGRMAMVAIGYLPMPLTKEERENGTDRLRVEGEFTFDMHGVKMIGYKDLEHWKEGESGRVFVVHDHKSCGTFKYVKKADDLRTDVQAITYAQHAFKKRPELRELELNWDYTTKGKDTQHKRTHLTVYRDETDEKAKVIADIGKQILEIKKTSGRTIDDVNKLPFNLETCDKYRGCPYQDVCSLTPLQRAQGRLRFHTNSQSPTTRGTTMNFADMKARLAQKTTTTAPTTPATQPAETPAAAAPAQTIREKLATGINPPQTSQPTVTPTTSVALQTSVENAVQTKGAEVASQVAHSLEGQDPKVVETTPKRGKGRPPGAKNKTKEAVEEPTTPTAAVAEEVPESDAIWANGYALYINSAPQKSALSRVLLSDILGPIHEAIRTEYGAVHWSLIDHGQGKGVLADALRQRLEQEPLGRDVALIVNDRDPDAGPCLGVLERLAREVTRGF